MPQAKPATGSTTARSGAGDKHDEHRAGGLEHRGRAGVSEGDRHRVGDLREVQPHAEQNERRTGGGAPQQREQSLATRNEYEDGEQQGRHAGTYGGDEGGAYLVTLREKLDTGS